MKVIKIIWNMSSIILRVPSNFLRHAMAVIFNLICRIWTHWIEPFDPGKQLKTKKSPPPLCSGKWLNQTHWRLICVNVTKLNSDPQNSPSLSHKWSVELFVPTDQLEKHLLSKLWFIFFISSKILNFDPPSAWARVMGGEERGQESQYKDTNPIRPGPILCPHLVLII